MARTRPTAFRRAAVSHGAWVADEASSIELLPQLVVKLLSWQHHDKQYAGYEAHVALLEFGETLWLENFYIPFASPRPSLKKLASNISFEMTDK